VTCPLAVVQKLCTKVRKFRRIAATKQSRFTDEQIIGFLKQAYADMSVKELCRSVGFSQPTFYKWLSRFGGIEPSDVAKLRELYAEDGKLKRMYAELAVEIIALRAVQTQLT
jgi:putative transposase